MTPGTAHPPAMPPEMMKAMTELPWSPKVRNTSVEHVGHARKIARVLKESDGQEHEKNERHETDDARQRRR